MKILKLFGLLLPIIALIALMGFARSKQGEMICKSMDVHIKGQRFFVSEQQIKAIVDKASPNVVNRPVKQANLDKLEQAILKSPYVKEASVYADINGVLKIVVTQRDPVLRIINSNDEHFYIDEDGLKMPLSSNYTPRVPVAQGNIRESLNSTTDSVQTTMVKDLYHLTLYLQKDAFWKAQIGQFYVNPAKEIVLIPKVGQHKILLGDISNLQQKLSNLMIFYKKAMPRIGWGRYETINIKYANQIIGVKDTLKNEN